jgi:hypothetical protein
LNYKTQGQNVAGKLVPIEDSTHVVRRSGIKTLLHVNLIVQAGENDTEDSSVEYFENWDGKIHKNFTVGEGNRRPMGTIWDTETENLRDDYNQLLGFRVVDYSREGKCPKTLTAWLAERQKQNDPMTIEVVTYAGVPHLKLSFKLFGYYYYTYWFDTSRGYIMSRFEFQNADAKKIYSQGKAVVDKMEQVDGLWIPWKVTHTVGDPIASTDSYEVSKFSRAHLEDSKLEIEYPVGTWFWNTLEKKAYVVGKDGKITEEEIASPQRLPTTEATVTRAP